MCCENGVNSVRYQLALSAENIPSGEWDQFDGVGLVRGEYILRNAGVYVTLPEGRELIRSYLDRLCAMFYPRAVWYRFVELEAAEANVLAGIDVELSPERNPMVVTICVRRSVRFPEGFNQELEALSPVLDRWSNLGVTIPFTSDVSEVEFVRSSLKARGVEPELGIMAEIPAVLILLDRFLDMGVSSVVIGMNDLTSLVLGTARSTDRCKMCHPALMQVISDAREVTGRYGVTLSIAGYMPRELVQTAAQLGCDYAVLHYSYLPSYFPGKYDWLPELEKLQDIKKKTRSMIAAYMHEKNSL